MRNNPNSKRGQVRTAFNSGGEKEAIRVGKLLGLPEPKIRRWIKKFTASKAPSRALGQRRVKLGYWPERKGSVIQEGDEVSDVKFDDGVRRFIPNQHLVEIGG